MMCLGSSKRAGGKGGSHPRGSWEEQFEDMVTDSCRVGQGGKGPENNSQISEK